jgi:hypothetical protein
LKSRTVFDFAFLTLLLSDRVFEKFAKKDKVPLMVPSIAQVVFVTSPKALSEPQLPTLQLVCGALGRIKETHLCHMMWLSQRPDPRRN